MQIINLTPEQLKALDNEFRELKEAAKEGDVLMLAQVFDTYMKVGVIRHQRAKVILDTFGKTRIQRRKIPER